MLKQNLHWLLLEEQTSCFWKTFSTSSFMLYPTLNSKFFTGVSGHSENAFWVNLSSKYLFPVFKFPSQYLWGIKDTKKAPDFSIYKEKWSHWGKKNSFLEMIFIHIFLNVNLFGPSAFKGTLTILIFSKPIYFDIICSIYL